MMSECDITFIFVNPVKMSRRIPPQLRKTVWETHMSDRKSAYGKCYVCSSQIHILNFECGHVKSYHDGGDTTAENLRPICGSCNKSMGTQNLDEYKKRFFKSKEKSSTWSWFSFDFKRRTKNSDQEKLISGMCELSLDKSSGCQHILLRGPRKGQKCQKKNLGNGYCKTHSPKSFS